MQNATEDTEVKLCIQRRQVEAYQFYLYNKEVIIKNVLNHIVIQVLVLPLSYILYCDSVADREIKSQIVTPARCIEEE